MKIHKILLLLISILVINISYAQNGFNILETHIPLDQFQNWVLNDYINSESIQLTFDENFLSTNKSLPEGLRASRYQRKLEGYSVEGQGITAFTRNNSVVGFYSNMVNIGNPDLTVAITEEEAYYIASGINSPKKKRIYGELVVVPDNREEFNGIYRLAYKYKLKDRISIIDAKNGDLITSFTNSSDDGAPTDCEFSGRGCGGNDNPIATPTYHTEGMEPTTIVVPTLYDGPKEITVGYVDSLDTYFLVNEWYGKDIRVGFMENDNYLNIDSVAFTTNSNNLDPMDPNSFPDDFHHLQAFQAYWGANQAWEYFENVHGSSGYGGQREPIVVYFYKNSGKIGASFKIEIGNQGRIFLGDGNGDDINSLTDLGITAHEFSHGVIDVYSGLNYVKRESGALNEGFADIFGATVYFNSGYDPSYNLGENASESISRDIEKPKRKGNPNCYRGQYWDYLKPDNNNNLVMDIHNNSTVLSHWFYLASEGSTSGQNSNDFGYVHNIIGLGREKIINHVFGLLAVTPSYANYYDVKTVSVGIASIAYLLNPTEENLIMKETIEEAWKAVGIIGTPYKNYCTLNSISSNNNSKIESVYIGGNPTINDIPNIALVDKVELNTILLNKGENSSVHLGISNTQNSNMFCRIWIDYNNDGDFDDLGELVVQGQPNFFQMFSSNFVVPVDTKSGFTRMRVSASENGPSNNCGLFESGQVIDFTVRITHMNSNNQSIDNSNELNGNNKLLNNKFNPITVYPNPSNGNFIIELSNLSNSNQTVDIMNVNGVLIRRYILSKNKNKMQISDLEKGLYILKTISDGYLMTQKIVVR